MPEGKGTLYWPTGTKRSEGTFKNGKRHGYCNAYKEDGGIVFKGNYENDERVDGQALTSNGWKEFKRGDVHLKTPRKPQLSEAKAGVQAETKEEGKKPTKEACCAIF